MLRKVEQTGQKDVGNRKKGGGEVKRTYQEELPYPCRGQESALTSKKQTLAEGYTGLKNRLALLSNFGPFKRPFQVPQYASKGSNWNLLCSSNSKSAIRKTFVKPRLAYVGFMKRETYHVNRDVDRLWYMEVTLFLGKSQDAQILLNNLNAKL